MGLLDVTLLGTATLDDPLGRAVSGVVRAPPMRPFPLVLEGDVAVVADQVTTGGGVSVYGFTGGAGVTVFEYVHHQLAASASWVIVHSLDGYPNIRCEDSTGQDIEGDVTYVDANTIRVDYSTATAGTAYLS